MKLKFIIVNLLFSCTLIAMTADEPNQTMLSLSTDIDKNIAKLANLNKIIKEPISLKFQIAYKVAIGEIKVPKEKVVIDVLELIEKIKIVLYSLCSKKDKIYLINLLNDPDVNVRNFPKILKGYKDTDTNEQIIPTKQIILHEILLQAIYTNELDLLELVIYVGADVNFDLFDNVPLTEAAICTIGPRHEAIRALLNAGADPYYRDKRNNFSAFKYAMANDCMSAARMLVEFEPDALPFAACLNSPSVVSKLLKSGLQPDAQDKYGNTALIYAAGVNKKIFKMLLNAGATIDFQSKSGNTALMEAAMMGHKKIVQLILERDANPNIQNNEGKTALDLARQVKNKEIVQLIKSYCKKSKAKPAKNNCLLT